LYKKVKNKQGRKVRGDKLEAWTTCEGRKTRTVYRDSKASHGIFQNYYI